MNRLALAGTLALLYSMPVAGQTRPDLTRFDNREAAVRQVDGHWMLLAGQQKIKDLGTSEANAYEALRLVRDLRLTRYGAIGSPRPVMEYWLADDKVPQGIVNGLRQMPFDPDALRVEQAQGQWCLRDSRRVLFTFGPRREDAKQALDVLQRYGFNRIGYVGFPTPVMMIFLRSDDNLPAPQTQSADGPARASATTSGDMLQTFQLRPPTTFLADPTQPGEHVPIDWRQARVFREGNDWKLMAGDYCLANFGYGERDAQDALRVLQTYRVTEEYRVGKSSGVSCFLINGQPPRGLPFGLRQVPFRPEELVVKQVGERWVVFAGFQALPIAGQTQEEAEQIVQTIRKHRFDHLCQFGSANPAPLSFLVRER